MIERYASSEHGDLSMLSDTCVFRVMATGQEAHGPDAVQGLLDHFYHSAFDARIRQQGDAQRQQSRSSGKSPRPADRKGLHEQGVEGVFGVRIPPGIQDDGPIALPELRVGEGTTLCQ